MKLTYYLKLYYEIFWPHHYFVLGFSRPVSERAWLSPGSYTSLLGSLKSSQFKHVKHAEGFTFLI